MRKRLFLFETDNAITYLHHSQDKNDDAALYMRGGLGSIDVVTGNRMDVIPLTNAVPGTASDESNSG